MIGFIELISLAVPIEPIYKISISIFIAFLSAYIVFPKEEVKININGMDVIIKYGDIFETEENK